MKIQELVEKYERLNHDCFRRVDTSEVLKDLKQLDEPQPVEVPQFVADVIEGAREESPELEDAFQYTWGNGTKEFTEWYNKKSNRDLFARAWLDGYEVEKEKRYLVKVKGNIKENILVYGKFLERYYFTKSFSLDNAIYSHTRKELEEAGLSEVFNSPLFETVEVE